MSRTIRVRLRLLFLVFMCSSTWALQGFKGSQQGLCQANVPVTRTRIRSEIVQMTYVYTKRCKLFLKKCTRIGIRPVHVERPESYTVYAMGALGTICCYGYKVEDGECKPTCSRNCENGFCSAVNQCSCNEGFRKDNNNNYVCRPLCSKSCEHGVCISSETCSCVPGYKIDPQNKYVCNPVCSEGCTNGNCIAPETCSCLAGYEKDSSNDSICHPVCSQNCVNSKCTAPEVCTCLSGFVKNINQSNMCDPHCSEPCQNGLCSAPEVCVCHDGFQKSLTKSNECEPICSKPCVNAKCTAPDVCTCFDGFIKNINQSNMCDPHCSKPCKNGFCSAPEECVCHSGFRKNINDSNECDPVCSKRCVNSICSLPENCQCFEGYQLDSFDKYKCEPVCSRECKNSECREPEVCTCNEGYISEQGDSYSCIPYCPEGCVNSNCTEPNVCECLDGYKHVKDQPNVCTPVCSECLNADCVLPEVCECWEGYEMYTKNRCEPTCSSCKYGYCNSPETCGCWAGYDNPPSNNATCKPVCEDGCVNSECTAPNKCTCLNGFVNSTGDWNRCSPYCSKKCLNAICVNPEVCECIEGYGLDDQDPYSCVPICKNGCNNGICTSPETCNCFWGFKSLQNSSRCFDTLTSNCSFDWEFLIDYYPNQKCLDLSIQHRMMTINSCTFLKMLFTKYFHEFGYLKWLPIELTCTLNSTIDDNEPKIFCTTDQIIHYSEDISTVHSISKLSTLKTSYFLNSKSTAHIDNLSWNGNTLTVGKTSQEPNFVTSTTLSENARTNNVVTYYEHELDSNLHAKSLHGLSDYEGNLLPVNDGSMESIDPLIYVTETTTLVSFIEFEDVSNPQVNSNISYEELEGNKTRKLLIKINIDNIPYIKKCGILTYYFNNITETELISDFCVCSSQMNRTSCEGDFQLKLYICPCNVDQESKFVGDSGKGSLVLPILFTMMTFLLIVALLGIGRYFFLSKKPKKPEDNLRDELEKELKRRQRLGKDDEIQLLDVCQCRDGSEADL